MRLNESGLNSNQTNPSDESTKFVANNSNQFNETNHLLLDNHDHLMDNSLSNNLNRENESSTGVEHHILIDYSDRSSSTIYKPMDNSRRTKLNHISSRSNKKNLLFEQIKIIKKRCKLFCLKNVSYSCLLILKKYTH